MSKSKPAKALNVLIIDDDQSFVGDLQRDASPYRIKLDHVTNLEDGLNKLQEKGEKHFSGVIFDVICLKDRKQQIPDPSFISKAKEEFDKRAPALPKVILTGETAQADALKTFYVGNTNVYHKSSEQIAAMLTYLVDQAENLPHIRIAKKYVDVFWLFDNGHLDTTTELRLVDVLEKMIDPQPNVISTNLGDHRKIQEAVYLALNALKPETMPATGFETWKDPKFSDFMKNLIELGYVEKDKIIDRSSWLLHKISSEYGAHIPKLSPDFPPTKYTVQMCTFAVLDLLLWFKSIVENK